MVPARDTVIVQRTGLLCQLRGAGGADPDHHGDIRVLPRVGLEDGRVLMASLGMSAPCDTVHGKRHQPKSSRTRSAPEPSGQEP